MALKDRIDIETATMAVPKRQAFFKGLAYYFDVKNPDGTLDTSDNASLKELWRVKVAQMVRRWSFNGQEYERDLVATDTDIED